MRKRKMSKDEEGSEMELENEQKTDQYDDESGDENDDSDEEDEEMNDAEEGEAIVEPRAERSGDTSFLDTFYGISSTDPRERAQASQTMLHHCFLGHAANMKDTAYAFRRLLNGLCSGRAGARQGNASALSSFLRLSFQLNKMEDIRKEYASKSSSSSEMETSLLGFVRDRLLATTDPSQTTGKKKGSEERDYHFGRLFGILALVRSTILIPTENGQHDLEDIIHVSSSLVSDLAELFWLKRWMREPAGHGILTLLNSFYRASHQKDSKKVVQHLVESVIVPKILLLDGNGQESKSNISSLLATYSAEQTAIAVHIQSQSQFHQDNGLPFPLNKPVLASETVELVSRSLIETSSVVQPRTHFVWDSIWSFLTEPRSSSDESNDKNRSKQTLRQTCPVGDESARDVLDSLVRAVIVAGLLRIEQAGHGSGSKTTHERRSLALCLVKNLCGVVFSSSISGAMQIWLEPDVLENTILTRDLVRSLFLDVICAGNQRKEFSHLLKPLALDVLRLIAEALNESDESSPEMDRKRRLAFVRSFLRCEIRFDARTKTTIVSDILQFKTAAAVEKDQFAFWDEYITYLEQQVVEKSASFSKNQSTAEATGNVELLYIAAKSILRIESESSSEELIELKYSMIRRIQGFFMAAAFFNCKATTVKGGKKKKKGNKSDKSSTHPILGAAIKLKGSDNGIPFSVRAIISARFYSLVSEHVNYATHHLSLGDDDVKQVKDYQMLQILVDLCEGWKLLESSGAERFKPSSGEEGEDEDDEDIPENPETLVSEFRTRVDKSIAALETTPSDRILESKKRCATGGAVLCLTLYIQLLSCGSPGDLSDNDDPDADDEDDAKEIIDAMVELKNIMDAFSEFSGDGDNPLLGLVESCANILSSPLGSGNLSRGAAPKLVREAVKFAWLGGLCLSAAVSTKERSLFDSDVVSVLLEGIGASEDGDKMNEDEPDDEEDDSDQESSDSSEDEAVFSKASGMMEDSDDMDVDKPDKDGGDSDSEVALDADKLQTMLEDDSDADVDAGELEHHEGADSALAKLIQLKQDARKAGQQAREKLEISSQLRCTLLLELLIVRSEGWNSFFRSDIILKLLMPMLRHRQEIEKSLQKDTTKGSNSATAEKKGLLDRLSFLLTKLCKMRLSSTLCNESVDIIETAKKLSSELIVEMKKKHTTEHSSCCSNGMIMVLRAIPSTEDALSVAAVYGDAVTEWSSKKTTRIQARLFDDLILHIPSLALTTLMTPLSKAATEARSPFLKSEAFRLLSQLLATKLPVDPDTSSIEKTAIKGLLDTREQVIDAIVAALQDEDMKKSKRVRLVLKATDKFIASLSPPSSQELLAGLGNISELLDQIKESESSAVKNSCEKLLSAIDSKTTELSTAPKESASGEKTATPASEEPWFAAGSSKEGSSKKKNKKKKKKKKR